MNWTPFMHGLGVACLICIAAIAVASLVNSLVPNWPRIWDTARGRPWPIAQRTGFPNAPVPPHRSRCPLRTVEAAARRAAVIKRLEKLP